MSEQFTTVKKNLHKVKKAITIMYHKEMKWVNEEIVKSLIKKSVVMNKSDYILITTRRSCGLNCAASAHYLCNLNQKGQY